jgi:UDP-3-O-[3-hydroxymyristoyl] glucosamine N-acyltransferase
MTADPLPKTFSSQWAADTVGAQMDGPLVDGLTGLKGLDEATPTDVTFLANPKYEAQVESTKAQVLIAAKRPTGFKGTVLLADLPYLAMATLAKALLSSPITPSISPAAHIDGTAKIGANVHIEALAYVGPGAVIGDNTSLSSQSHIGANAKVGQGCFLHPGSKVLERCELGDGVILQAGAIIGSDGFGYAPDASGKRHKIPQVGTVILGDNVEVGANATIDRATFGATHIGEGTKIDNLVQIAHNVVTGKDCIIVSQSGIAGSTSLGDRVIAGAQVGIVGHINVADDVMLGARAALTKSVSERSVLSGTPAIPHRDWLRYSALRTELPTIRRKVRALEKALSSDKDPKESS